MNIQGKLVTDDLMLTLVFGALLVGALIFGFMAWLSYTDRKRNAKRHSMTKGADRITQLKRKRKK
ncbi:hypothetical protein [Noviherbaspirillum galbum]|uniref:Uncharacterized protein n=1 Tax=Noviherbaspirillum galbum TaxID=2709383 RepID=A0A6B3SQW0_9BURK|nr:hypothetical protein [Noviherbaspirillum galbum]NEX63310.1 hypothetical protein [Noviherbaspirillum galbum]